MSTSDPEPTAGSPPVKPLTLAATIAALGIVFGDIGTSPLYAFKECLRVKDTDSNILGTSQAPLEKDVARSIAELWVNYQLVGVASAEGDSLSDKKTMDQALWSNIDNIRVKKFYDNVSKGWESQTPGPDEQRYMNGEAMAARHILVKVEANATPEQKAAAMKKAEGIRAEATPANFAKLAAKSDEPGAGERGGEVVDEPYCIATGSLIGESNYCIVNCCHPWIEFFIEIAWQKTNIGTSNRHEWAIHRESLVTTCLDNLFEACSNCHDGLAGAGATVECNHCYFRVE